MALLEVDNLGIRYQTAKGALKALDDVCFSLEEGRSLGFVGESGCGKTTLGMALMGLLPPNGLVSAGRILFDAENLLDKTDAEMRHIRWKKMAMIFQAAMNALNPVHRIADQIAEAIITHSPGTSKDEVFRQVEGLFQLVGIPRGRMRDYPHQYSGGMKQRAIIAMALACKPKLIIADEPTTALDVIVQDQILEEAKKFQEEFNISMIFISHDISVVADVCHQIGVLYAGQLVELGTREEVIETPRHPYTQALLSSFLTIRDDGAELKPIPGETPNLIRPPAGCRFCDRCFDAADGCNAEVPVWIQLSATHGVLCSRYNRQV